MPSTSRNWRWTCNECGTQGWQVIERQGEIPQHDRPDGRQCLKSRVMGQGILTAARIRSQYEAGEISFAYALRALQEKGFTEFAAEQYIYRQ